jgi:tripartite-type tricarboxylate transporter receptor subunit TctC
MQRVVYRLSLLLVAVVAFAASASDLFAQGYPNRPIRVIVPYGAGGGTDITLRAVQQKIEAVLGQSLIVEYRAGGGTLIGTKVVEAAAPDGYTLGVFDPAFIINPTISSSANYDPLKNFTPVSLISATPLIFAVPPESPFKTLKELLDYAKANPGKLTYGSPGIGSGGHMAMEQFCHVFDLKIVHDPYKGSGPGIVALLAGQMNMMMVGSGITPYVQLGKLRALAVTSAERLPALPNVPTFTELGYPNVNVQTFAGVVAPAGTPKEVIDKLHNAVATAVRTPEVRDKLVKFNQFPVGNTPEEFREFLQTNAKSLQAVARDSHIKID